MPGSPASSATVLALAAALFSGCSGIGAAVGHMRDLQNAETRVVPRERVASIRPGNLVFVTIPDRETLRGPFRGMADSSGARLLRVEAEGGEARVPLDRVTEVVEQIHDHRRMRTGFWIGASVDALLIGGAVWLYREHQERIIE